MWAFGINACRYKIGNNLEEQPETIWFWSDVAKVQKRDTLGNFNLKDEHYSTYLASIYYDLPKRLDCKT